MNCLKKYDSNFSRGVLAVIGNLQVDFSIGELNLLGFLYPYFIAYFRINDPTITLKDMKIIPILWMLVQIVSCPLGIYVYMRLDFRATYMLFITSFCTVQFLCSYITDFYTFGIIYGISGGLSQGALMILPLYCGWRYFNARHKPTISGILLSAYAICPVFTSVFAFYVINPDNLQQEKFIVDGHDEYFFPLEVAENVPKFLRYFAIFCFTMGAAGVCLIFDPIEDEETLLQESENPNNARSRIVIKTESIMDGVRRFKDPLFRKLSITMLFSYLYPHVMNFGFKSIGLKYLNDDSYVTFCGSMSAICNAMARFTFGHYFIRFGFKTLMYTIIGFIIVNACTFVWFSHYHYTYLIAVLMFVVTYGGQLGSFPLVSDKLYGDRGALAYAILQIGFDMSNVLGLIIYSTTIDYVGWAGVLQIFAVLSQVPLLYVNEIDQEIEGRKVALEM